MSALEHTCPLPTWAAADYLTITDGDHINAHVLADRAVAPLVAAARGYEAFNESNAAEKLSSDYKLGGKNEVFVKQQVEVAGNGTLMLPWYAPITMQSPNPRPSWRQFRPVEPREAPDGEPVKYDVKSGTSYTLDVHPATPRAWLKGAEATCPIIVAEGMFKADALVTGMLRAAGVSNDDLAYAGDDARDRLSALLSALTAEQRHLVIGVQSVGTWNRPEEWALISLNGRHVRVSFDADYATNSNVWTQASKILGFMRDRGAEVSFLNLAATDDALMPGPPGLDIAKMGADDYLAQAGTFTDLLARTVHDIGTRPLPKRPLHIGDWRMNEETLTAEKYATVNDDMGSARTAWVEGAPFVGRMTELVTVRELSRREEATGVLDITPENAQGEVSVEVTWIDPSTGDHKIAEVRGDAVILSETPRDWNRRAPGKINIPPDLHAAPDWPIADVAWMRAMKAHRRDDCVETNEWASTGWVPTVDSTPVFLTAPFAIDASGATDRAVFRKTGGPSDHIGVIACDDPVTLHDDIMKTWHAYAGDPRTFIDESGGLLVDVGGKNPPPGGPWANPAVGGVVLAAALRPIAPIVPRCSALFVGQSNSGKSWSISATMAFWQPQKGYWSGDRLPGSAKDTSVSIEINMARSPIWTIDDVAPSASRHGSDSDMAKLEDALRNQWNRTGKGRATTGIESRRTLAPRCVLLASAENPTSVRSVRNRTVFVDVRKGFIYDGDALEHVNDLSRAGVQSRVTYAAAKMLATIPEGAQNGWDDVLHQWEVEERAAAGAVVDMVFGNLSANRTRDLTTDLLLGLSVWRMLFVAYDFDPRYVRHVDLMMGWVAQFTRELAVGDRQHTSGQRLLAALREVLQSQRAFIGTDDGQAPHPTDAKLNAACGWEKDKDGVWTHRGTTRIGTAVWHEDQGKKDIVIFFETQAAFNVAKNLSELIPSGQTSSTGWASMWDEGMTVNFWRRQKSRGGERVSARGAGQVGVPVALSTLMSAGAGLIGPVDDDPDDDLDDEDVEVHDDDRAGVVVIDD